MPERHANRPAGRRRLQIIVGPDGSRGVCYEHSPAEAIVLLQMLETVVQHPLDAPAPAMQHHPALNMAASPKKLVWKIDHHARRCIEQAQINHDKYYTSKNAHRKLMNIIGIFFFFFFFLQN